MDIINRSVLVIYVKEKFEKWVNALPNFEGEEKLTLAEINAFPSTFLIPEFEEEDEGFDYLNNKKKEIFSVMLNSWAENSNQVTIDIESEDFFDWFEAVFAPMVLDLDYAPLVKDQFELVEE